MKKNENDISERLQKIESDEQEIRQKQTALHSANLLLETEKEKFNEIEKEIFEKQQILEEREQGIELRQAEVELRERKVEDKIKLHNLQGQL